MLAMALSTSFVLALATPTLQTSGTVSPANGNWATALLAGTRPPEQEIPDQEEPVLGGLAQKPGIGFGQASGADWIWTSTSLTKKKI
jgi:hypothetical protein